MTSYSINVQFDQQGLQQFLTAGLTVGLIQEVQGGAAPVAWLVFNPMLSNTIQWEDNYAVYVSTSQLVAGVILEILAQQPAMTGTTYTYQGEFMPQPGPSGAIGLINGQPGGAPLTGGLALQANVNGRMSSGPFVASNLLPQQMVAFTPPNKVQIAAMQNVANGQFMPRLASPGTTVDLASNPSQTVQWDDEQGRFVPGQ